MRILLIAYHFPPSQSVAADRMLGFAEALAEEGHSVTVLTATTGTSSAQFDFEVVRLANPVFEFAERYLSWFRTSGGSAAREGRSSLLRWTVQPLTRLINDFRTRRGILFLGRMPDIADFWLPRGKRWLRGSTAFDCVIASYAPYASLLLGEYAKKNGHAQYLLCDFRDPWIQHHLFRGLPGFRLLEKRLYKRVIAIADTLTAATWTLADVIYRDSGITSICVLNGAAPVESEAFDIPGLADNPDATVIVHTGSTYTHKARLEELFSAISILQQNPQRKTLLYFAGNNESTIDSLIKSHRLEDKVFHLGMLSRHHAQHLISIANLCVSFDYNDEQFAGVIPVKLFDYLEHKKPILLISSIEQSDSVRFLSESGEFFLCSNSAPRLASTLSGALASQKQPPPSPQTASRSFNTRPLLSALSALESQL